MSLSLDPETLRNRIDGAIDGSRIIGATRYVGTALSGWAHDSRIVQWFLAEPEPEVIVVDLRETYTVGPVLRVLDWTTARINRFAERTGLDAAAEGAARRVAAEPLRSTGWFLLVCALGGLIASVLRGGALGGWLVLGGIALLATRERRSATELAESRLGRALIGAFEPPDPPENEG